MEHLKAGKFCSSDERDVTKCKLFNDKIIEELVGNKELYMYFEKKDPKQTKHAMTSTMGRLL